jgi:hypothetical protein
MSKKDHKTAMAVCVDGKWLIGLPLPTQPQPVRLPLPARAPRKIKPRDGGPER